MPSGKSLTFLFIFFAFPLIELALLVKIAGAIGFWPTVGIIFGTAILGLALLSRQGLSTLRRTSEAMTSGRLPEHLTDGALLMLAALFLVAPGIITDTLGIVLLISPIRHGLVRWGFSRMPPGMSGNNPDEGYRPRRVDDGGPVIEGEYERVDENRNTDRRRRDPNGSSSA